MQLHYTLHNPDKPESVLLLHGLGSAAEDWELQLPALTPRYRVLAPDVRGHGRSPRPPGRFLIAEAAADVAELMQVHKVGSAHVAGLSMGGAIALQLAIEYPHLVDSLVLVNTFARVRPNGWRGLQRFFQRVWALRFGSLEDVGQTVMGNLFPKPEQSELRRMAVERFVRHNTDKAAYSAILRGVLSFDVRRRLGGIRCPALVVAGERDLTVPMSCKRELQRGIPQARLIVIADSGHATPIDQPERFNRALLDFLGQPAGQPAAPVR